MSKVKRTYNEDFGLPSMFIGISAIIGAGKSTLTKQLAEKIGWEPIYEPVKENPYLPLFYKDMYRYGFNMQIFLLNKRFALHQQVVWKRDDNGSIQDRTIYEDVIFAKMLNESGKITDLDYQTYRETFINMTHFLHRPDFILYLDVKPEKALERIKARGRECEKDLPLEYLKDLREGYEDWIKNASQKIPIIRIDWNNFKTVDEVVDIIKDHISSRKRHMLHLL